MWKAIVGACAIGLVSSAVVAQGVQPKMGVTAEEGGMCYGLQPMKDTPDFGSWLKEQHTEATDQADWKLKQVYNESIAQKYINSGKPVFVFRPHKYRWYFYQNGELVEEGVANGGQSYCPDIGKPCRTPSGVFTVYNKGGAGCRSSKFPVDRSQPRAIMPYCMYLKRADGAPTGYAIHGSAYINPGRHGSHGCIRVQTPAAELLSSRYIGVGTTVVITNY